MKYLAAKHAIVTLTCLSLWLCGCSAPKANDYQDLTYPRLKDIVIPSVQQTTLPNGLQLFLLEDHELPLVHMSARIRTGSIYEPADKIGLADITGEVMRTGGTVSRTGDELDQLLEQIAASVETSIGLDSGYASASALKEDVDIVLEVLADVMMHPAFREDKIALAKMQHRSSIARRNDDPGDIAAREFRKLIYGPDNIYARHTEYATIDAITQADLQAFHQRFFVPNQTMLAVWGDFDSATMIEKIQAAFKDWTPTDVPPPQPEAFHYNFKSSVNLIPKDDVNQSNIFMGHIGGMLNNPDYFDLVIMNRILGSSFTGRLFKNVRSRQGLAYSVYGYYSANYTYPGLFYLVCQTKSESTVQAIKAMTEEIRKMIREQVTDEELALAKESFLNSFVFNFDTKGEIINRLMTYAYYGYPLDFLQTTKTRVEQVGKEDVQRVARTYLQPDKLQILVVGQEGGFDQSLSTLGPVHQIDISIPEPNAASD